MWPQRFWLAPTMINVTYGQLELFFMSYVVGIHPFMVRMKKKSFSKYVQQNTPLMEMSGRSSRIKSKSLFAKWLLRRKPDIV